MTPLALSALLAASGSAAAAPAPPMVMAQLVIRQRVILRVPTRPVSAAPAMRWIDRKGPRCITTATIAAAAVSGRDTIDLILRGGQRLRARFSDSCPALDYYRGFYLQPTEDGRLCADRDAIHARSGGECEIERFRTLVAEPIAAGKPGKPVKAPRHSVLDILRGKRK